MSVLSPDGLRRHLWCLSGTDDSYTVSTLSRSASMAGSTPSSFGPACSMALIFAGCASSVSIPRFSGMSCNITRQLAADSHTALMAARVYGTEDALNLPAAVCSGGRCAPTSPVRLGRAPREDHDAAVAP